MSSSSSSSSSSSTPCCACACACTTTTTQQAAATTAVVAATLPEDHPRRLIPELCRMFYDLKWVTGTGGGISMKYGDDYYLAPSGVQKERIEAEDLFVLHAEDDAHRVTAETPLCDMVPSTRLVTVASPPPHKRFTPSQCTPLFFNAFTLRGASACIHTHSQAAVLVTLMYDREFRITHQEMIKGIRIGSTKANYAYYDELVVPIIENTPEEKDLTTRMHEAMQAYPDCNAILVRRHGVYVWGESWQKAKTMCECYDYLFELAVEMRKLGMEPGRLPAKSEYASVRRTYPDRNRVGESELEEQTTVAK